MSLLSLPERFLQRLIALPLELFSMILGSQKSLTHAPYDPFFTGWGDPYLGRYQSEANKRGVRLRRKREEHRARHAGLYSMPRSAWTIWEVWRMSPLNWLPTNVHNPRKRGREDMDELDTVPQARKSQGVERLFVL